MAKTGASKAQETVPGNPPAPNDDVHLAELVRSLRLLAGDSPERQARIEQLARSYASGSYRVNTHATASKIIDDSFND